MKRRLDQSIEEDIYRYFGKNERPIFFRSRVRALKYTTTLRRAQYYRDQNLKVGYILCKIMLRIYSSLYLIQIPVNTKIGRGLYIGHLGSVIVNENAVLGDNVNLAVGVTIGQTNRGPNKGCPTIGNMVWVGTNAVIVGRVTVGNNVLIAPNSYVNKDIPSNSIAIGNPAKIIPKDNATAGYVHNVVE